MGGTCALISSKVPGDRFRLSGAHDIGLFTPVSMAALRRRVQDVGCRVLAGWSLWAPGPTANECSTRCRRTRMAAIERPNLRTQHDDLRSPFPARGNIASKVILRNMK